MARSKTINSLQRKIKKITLLLLLIRFSLYIPVPNLDLNLFDGNQTISPIFGLTKNFLNTSFLSIGTLGILPYINASIIMQLCIPFFPALEKKQNEEGEFGRREIAKYTRYLTLFWALILSSAVSLFLVKPRALNWSFEISCEIILSLTVGAMLCMWLSELITEEKFGNGSSMVIFINIISGFPSIFTELENTNFISDDFFQNATIFSQISILYIFINLVIIFFQDTSRHIHIISARNLNLGVNEDDLRRSYIPLKINHGGVMPLVFSSTFSAVLFYPLQLFLQNIFLNQTSFISTLISICFVSFNGFLVFFFSSFYATLTLKPKDIASRLSKRAYVIPGIRPGKKTLNYLGKTIKRLAFLGGLFLLFLTSFPFITGNIFQISVFKNVTSLLILIGVITDTTSRVESFLIINQYKN